MKPTVLQAQCAGGMQSCLTLPVASVPMSAESADVASSGPIHEPPMPLSAPVVVPVRQEKQPARTVVEEVAPGVLRAQLHIELPGLAHINTYLLVGPDGVDVIDPGLPGPASWSSLLERLAQAEIPVTRVRSILITHSHPDHFGNAERLAEASGGAKIITHRSFRTMFDPLHQCVNDEDCVDPAHAHPDFGQKPFKVDVRIADGVSPAAAAPWGKTWNPHGDEPSLRKSATLTLSERGWPFPKPNVRVRSGDSVSLGGRDWQVVHTPGHTLDHLCLFDPETGTFVSGDHVLPTITPHVPGIGSGDASLANFLGSLDTVAALPGVTRVLPAHGLDFDDLPGRVREVKAHHQDRLELLSRVSQADGWTSVEGYSHFLFRPERWGSMAESETYAHLVYLAQIGMAETRRATDGQAEYLVHGAPVLV
jgi:glyoxylase-like metal-dependent hydrolase (beta-lactamase superfamily II)